MKKLRVIALFVAGAATAAFAAPYRDLTATHEFLIGTTMHFSADEGIVDEVLQVMQQGGHNVWRGDASWSTAQKNAASPVKLGASSQAAVDASCKYGIAPLLILAYTNKIIDGRYPVGSRLPPYVNYCDSIVAAEKGKVHFYQVWNEWDGSCGVTPEVSALKENTVPNYLKLLRESYRVIKRNDPESIVIANSVCSGDNTLLECFRSGMLDYCDAYAIHSYTRHNPERVYNRLKNLAEASANFNNNQPKPFYLTEQSWITHTAKVSEATQGISEAMQGDYIARLFLLFKSLPSCRGVMWYNFNERGDDYKRPTLFWGMVNRDMTPKDAYYCLASVAETVKKGKFEKRLSSEDKELWLMVYQMPDGSRTLAAWTEKPGIRVQVILNRGDAPSNPLTFIKCGHPVITRNWGFRDQTIDRLDVPVDWKQFSFYTTTRPVLIGGLPKDFKVEKIAIHLFSDKK